VRSTRSNVCIVGLGKIGLPLAIQFASKGASVTGYDVDPARVATINAGRDPLFGEPGIADALPELVSSGLVRATCDPREAASSAETIVFIVPVDIDANHRPDFAVLDAAVEAVAPHVQRGALVIVETTVPVGTTRYRVAAKVMEQTGMTAGADFWVAFSPRSGDVSEDRGRYRQAQHRTRGGVLRRNARRVDLACARHGDGRILEARRDDVP
jgi:nucleotide sugar dehydrogenase